MNGKANQPTWANAVTVPGEVVGLAVLQDCILIFKINWFYSCIIYIKEKHRSGVYSFMSLVDWKKKKKAATCTSPSKQALCKYSSMLTLCWPWDLICPMGYWNMRLKQNLWKYFHMGLAYISWKPLNHNCLKKAKLAYWMMINMWSTHLFCSSRNLSKHHKCECDHLGNLVQSRTLTPEIVWVSR